MSISGKNFLLSDVLKTVKPKKILSGQYIWIPEINLRMAADFKAKTDLRIGFNCSIGSQVFLGENSCLGHNCVIESDVVSQENLTLEENVTLASGTRLGKNVDLSRCVITTGLCYLGDNVKVRANSTISNSWIIESWAFFGAGIMTSHTQHVSHGRPALKNEQFLSRVGYGAIIGSGVQCGAGVNIGPGAVIGYNAFVRPGSNLESHSIYFNRPHPWATIQKTLHQDDAWYLDVPKKYQTHYFSSELLKKYLPGYDIPSWIYELEKTAQTLHGIITTPVGWKQRGPLNRN